MTPSRASASATRPEIPDFSRLVEYRREWRRFHERQDRENADRVFREAGVGRVGDGALKFFPFLFREKLNEFGRDWERALAARGLKEGLSFYRIPISVSVEGVGSLHPWIEVALEGKGASLFFESNGLRSLSDGIWEAIFYFALRPELDPDSIDFALAPGVAKAGKTLKIA